MNPNQTITSPTPTPSVQPVQNSQSSTMALQFNSAIKFAQQNPDSAQATELMRRIQSGQMNDYLQAAGYDPSRFTKQAPPPTAPASTNQNTPSILEMENKRAQNVASDILRPAQINAQDQASGVSNFDRGVHTAVATAETGLRTAGNVAGGVLDIISGLTPGPVKDYLSNVAKGIGNAQIIGDNKTIGQHFADVGNLLQQHPEAAKDVGAITDILGLLGTQAGAEQIGKVNMAGAAKNAGQTINQGATDIASAIKNKFSPTPSDPVKTALDAITPKTKDLTPTEYADLLRSGKITPKTTTQPARYVLSQNEKALAEKFAPLLQESDPVKNINNVVTEIINKDKQVGDFLSKNPQVYTKGDLKNAIQKSLSDVTDVTVPKNQLSEARKDLLNTIMSKIPENNTGRTFDKLWEFRKNLDQTIENKMRAFSGAPTLKKDMGRAIRNGIQDFIANNTPDGVYKNSMKDMSQMYDLIDKISPGATKERGLSAIQTWIKANPTKAKIIGYGLGGGLIVGGAKSGLGL